MKSIAMDDKKTPYHSNCISYNLLQRTSVENTTIDVFQMGETSARVNKSPRRNRQTNVFPRLYHDETLGTAREALILGNAL